MGSAEEQGEGRARAAGGAPNITGSRSLTRLPASAWLKVACYGHHRACSSGASGPAGLGADTSRSLQTPERPSHEPGCRPSTTAPARKLEFPHLPNEAAVLVSGFLNCVWF